MKILFKTMITMVMVFSLIVFEARKSENDNPDDGKPFNPLSIEYSVEE